MSTTQCAIYSYFQVLNNFNLTKHSSRKINFNGSHVTVYVSSVLNRAEEISLYRVKLEQKY